MSWRIVHACVVGTSHLATNAECQDSCLTSVEFSVDKEPLLYIFVADGAGSAINGGKGAELAVSTAAQVMDKHYSCLEFALHDELAVECVLAIRREIDKQAEKESLLSRDYACTFLGLVSFAQSTLVMQIGDGGIVVDFGKGLQVPITPMSGEYANMTYFVTDKDAVDVLLTKYFPEKTLKAAIFTDGIQRLALNMVTNTAYEPFFNAFFSTVAKATPEQEDQLDAALISFLNSKAVNERTDDDKTLALAVLVG